MLPNKTHGLSITSKLEGAIQMRTEPLMNFTHTEGPGGTLRPNIQVNDRYTEQEIGKFGRAWKTFMQKKHPQRVSEMLMEGTFHATMKVVDEEAENHKEDLIQDLVVQKPCPQTDDTLERVAHMEALTRLADELTMVVITQQLR